MATEFIPTPELVEAAVKLLRLANEAASTGIETDEDGLFESPGLAHAKATIKGAVRTPEEMKAIEDGMYGSIHDKEKAAQMGAFVGHLVGQAAKTFLGNPA